MVLDKKLMIYFVRHAEAEHNVKEKEAMKRAKEQGGDKQEQELARKRVLRNSIFRDSPLSLSGELEAKNTCDNIDNLVSAGDERYQPPKVILVSPLRRTLMTATLLFYNPENDNNPQFFALEALREKRTGLACDERQDADTLRSEFPHINFDSVERGLPVVPVGEDNVAVKARTKKFLEECLPYYINHKFVALVSHKGWLREMRHTLKEYVVDGTLEVDFDVDGWDQILYKNAEVRVAEFKWRDTETETATPKLESIISRSISNATRSIIDDANLKVA